MIERFTKTTNRDESIADFHHHHQCNVHLLSELNFVIAMSGSKGLIGGIHVILILKKE